MTTVPRHPALALALLAALALPVGAGAGAVPALRDQTRLPSAATSSIRLSNERTSTRWAHPVRRAPIRFQPTSTARLITTTHMLTEDGFPEVYIALRSWKDPEGKSWVEVRIPMRPNGRTGWVRHSALGPLYRCGPR